MCFEGIFHVSHWGFGVSQSIGGGYASPEGRVFAARSAFLGFHRGVICSLCLWAGGDILIGSQRCPFGSAVATAMLCCVWIYNSIVSMGAIVPFRHPSRHRGGGDPVKNHTNMALWRAIMWFRVMWPGRNSCGCLSPRSRCRVVLMAKVPHGHGERGLSSCIAIVSPRPYRGSGGGGVPRALKDSLSALRNLVCIFMSWNGGGLRGSSNVMYYW